MERNMPHECPAEVFLWELRRPGGAIIVGWRAHAAQGDPPDQPSAIPASLDSILGAVDLVRNGEVVRHFAGGVRAVDIMLGGTPCRPT